MPKAKPKAARVWMNWAPVSGFRPWEWGTTKRSNDAIRVRIMPEAEYQRLIAATKRKDKDV